MDIFLGNKIKSFIDIIKYEKHRVLFFNIAKYLCLIFPINKKVVFANFNGKGFGDNPKYIAEEILRKKLNWDLVWLSSDPKDTFPKGIRHVFWGSFRSVYELSTARVIINNVKNGLPFYKRDSQYYIQTWHGCFPLKYIEKEAEIQLSKSYIAASKTDSSITDLLLSSSKSDSEIYKKAFWYSGEIYEKGIPRNDIFFKKNDNIKKHIKEQLGVSQQYKIVLYAPTFRDNNDNEVYNLAAEKVADVLERKTGDKWVVIIRLHPNVNSTNVIFNYNKRVINGSTISDSQHLVIASDCLITDYSSIMMDFCLMQKPVFLYTPDLENYSHSRGLRPIFYKLPFILSLNNEDLINAIIQTDFQDYLTKANHFVHDEIKSFDNGHASESVVLKIMEVINRIN